MTSFIIAAMALLLLSLSVSTLGDRKKINIYKRKLRALKRKTQKSEDTMSKIIDTLVGKTCKSENFGTINVLDADDEWIKFSYTDKRGEAHTRIERIEELDSLEILDDKA